MTTSVRGAAAYQAARAAAAANDVAGRNVHRVGRVGLEPTTGGL